MINLKLNAKNNKRAVWWKSRIIVLDLKLTSDWIISISHHFRHRTRTHTQTHTIFFFVVKNFRIKGCHYSFDTFGRSLLFINSTSDSFCIVKKKNVCVRACVCCVVHFIWNDEEHVTRNCLKRKNGLLISTSKSLFKYKWISFHFFPSHDKSTYFI